MQVRFWGTRGSIATPGRGTVRYGGNTSCVEVRSASGTLVLLDCGTGARGARRDADGLGHAPAARPHPHRPHALGSHPGIAVLRAAVRAGQRVGHLRAARLRAVVARNARRPDAVHVFPDHARAARRQHPLSRNRGGRLRRRRHPGHGAIPQPPRADARLSARGGRRRGRLRVRSRAACAPSGRRLRRADRRGTAVTSRSSPAPISSSTTRSTRPPSTRRSAAGATAPSSTPSRACRCVGRAPTGADAPRPDAGRRRRSTASSRRFAPTLRERHRRWRSSPRPRGRCWNCPPPRAARAGSRSRRRAPPSPCPTRRWSASRSCSAWPIRRPRRHCWRRCRPRASGPFSRPTAHRRC